MKWLQLKVVAAPTDAESISEVMEEAGALSVTLTDGGHHPLYEPPLGTQPLWPSTIVTALFQEKRQLDLAVSVLKTHEHRLRLSVDELAEQDWLKESQRNRPVLQFGQLWIAPPGFEPKPADAVLVTLEPGIAFGTGSHPTTALCLRWLSQHPPLDAQVLDYGCGSGILSLAAVKLGARRVVAVDHDLQALEATRQNAVRNDIGLSVHVTAPDEVPDAGYELIMANILLNPLIELAPVFSRLLAPSGTVVFSGITTEQVSTLETACSNFCRFTEVVADDGWACVSGVRHP